jgi:hypothetical protein
MIKSKPLPILLLAAAHLLAPIPNVIYACAMQETSLVTYIQIFFKDALYLEFFNAFFLFPLAAFAILSVRKWSYLVYLSCMIFSAYMGYRGRVEYPNFFSLGLLTFGYCLTVLIVAYFLLPEVRLAYLDPQQRWWEVQPRYRVSVPAKIASLTPSKGELEWINCTVLDLSLGGAFILPEKSLEVKDSVRLKMPMLHQEFEVAGSVAHFSKKDIEGYGIQFALSRKFDPLKFQVLDAYIHMLRKTGVSSRSNSTEMILEFKNWLGLVRSDKKMLLPISPYSRDRKPNLPVTNNVVSFSTVNTSQKKTEEEIDKKRAA